MDRFHRTRWAHSSHGTWSCSGINANINELVCMRDYQYTRWIGFCIREHLRYHSRICLFVWRFVCVRWPARHGHRQHRALPARAPLLHCPHSYRATAKHTHGLAIDICLSVCLSVRLSNACIVIKRKHLAKKSSIMTNRKSPTSFPMSLTPMDPPRSFVKCLKTRCRTQSCVSPRNITAFLYAVYCRLRPLLYYRCLLFSTAL